MLDTIIEWLGVFSPLIFAIIAWKCFKLGKAVIKLCILAFIVLFLLRHFGIIFV